VRERAFGATEEHGELGDVAAVRLDGMHGQPALSRQVRRERLDQ
jgi:hypothetical protein